MNKQQYNNIINHTLADEQVARNEDSLATTRAIFNNMGVAIPSGSMREVYETLKTNDYMGWRACTREEALQATNDGIAAIGISDSQIVVLAADDETVARTTIVDTDIPDDSAKEYYSYSMGTTTSWDDTEPQRITEYGNHRVGTFETPVLDFIAQSYIDSDAEYDSIPYNVLYEIYYTSAFVTATGGSLSNMPDAARLLQHFLENNGTTETIDLKKMISEDDDARAGFVEEIDAAMEAAERFLAYYNSPVAFSNIEENTNIATPDTLNNWYQAIHEYRTWCKCIAHRDWDVYSMTVEYNLRDFYDWNPNNTNMSPIVTPEQMYTLHCAGMAKNFKVEAKVTVTVSWRMGQRVSRGISYSIE